MTTPEEYGDYSQESVDYWQEADRRHFQRNMIHLRRMRSDFRPGTVLDVGSGCGGSAKILESLGFDVTASDLQPFFVDFMCSIGLRAEVIDATEISKYTTQRFDNIFAQALSPQVRKNEEISAKTYASIHEALVPHGRLIFWFAELRTMHYRKTYFSPAELVERVDAQKLFRVISVRRLRFLPTRIFNAIPLSLAVTVDDLGARLHLNTVRSYVLERQ